MPTKKFEKADVFTLYGVSVEDRGSGNYQGDCPFCGKNGHFYLNNATGQWDCKVCGQSGNVPTFLAKITTKYHKEMADGDWTQLAQMRGIPASAFRKYGVARFGDDYLIPIRSENGTVRDVRRWTTVDRNGTRKVKSTPGCTLQLFGAYELFRAKSTQRIWVCEGEWDAIALRWLLDKSTKYQDDVVVGIPGAATFKDDWAKYFSRKGPTIVCTDNDAPGDDGALKIYSKLKGYPRDLKFLHWPESRPKGWDVRDFVIEGRNTNTPADVGIEALLDLCKPQPRHVPIAADGKPTAAADGTVKSGPLPPQPGEKPVSFPKVLEVFRKWAMVDDEFEKALQISMAVAMSNKLAGDPLWMYLIGDPGGGKSLILTSLKESFHTSFHSTLTPKSLVSGWASNPDPSLLPRLDGLTAVFKDGTELLEMHPVEKGQCYGTLRGAFDGYVDKDFGNGVRRNYQVRFNVLIGVTPAIHGDSQASMGDRFLKFQLVENRLNAYKKKEKAIEQAIMDETKMEAELGGVVRLCMLRDLTNDNMPKIGPRYVSRIIHLSDVIARIRAHVDRHQWGGEGELRNEPIIEAGTRPAKQLAKLGRALAFLHDMPEIDDDVYRMLERVTLDTGNRFHVKIILALVQYDGLTKHQIMQECDLPESTCRKRLDDMMQLGLVKRIRAVEDGVVGKRGPSPDKYYLRDAFLKSWNLAMLDPKNPGKKP